MAHPNIQKIGAPYPTVPSVLLPVAGGGQAEFFDMADDMAWLGADATLVHEITPVTVALKDTGFNTWTPSTTAATVVASQTL